MTVAVSALMARRHCLPGLARAWLAGSSIAEVAFEPLANDRLTCVGVHRLGSRRAEASALPIGPLFAFRVDDG